MGEIIGNKLKVFFVWIVLIVISGCASMTYAFDVDANIVRKAIQAKKTCWTAGETSISVFPPDQRKNFLGLIKPNKNDIEELSAADEMYVSTAAASVPASLDWRSYSGENYVTPVREQGGICGSCWAFATVAALESQVLMTDDSPDADFDLAEQILVSCSGAGDCAGGYIDEVSEYLRDVGVPLETCFPYVESNNSCSNACTDWQSSTYIISAYHWVTTGAQNVSKLKNALYNYGPLVTSMEVYSDFYYYTNGIYTQTSGNYEGGHAVLLVGYDDDDACFIVKNSWGTGWGENGFFRIAYSELNSSVSFGEYTIAYEGHTPPPNDLTCSYALSGTSASYWFYGGSGSVDVSTDDACSWTAKSNVSWITISNSSEATGSNTVGFKVVKNSNWSTRTGTMTIAGETFTVTQSGRFFWKRQ